MVLIWINSGIRGYCYIYAGSKGPPSGVCLALGVFKRLILWIFFKDSDVCMYVYIVFN